MRFVPVHNKGFKWYSNGNCWAKGYVFHEGNCLKGKELVNFFSELLLSGPADALAQVNGCFAVVLFTDDFAIAAADKFRSFPLFWAVAGKEIFISDDASLVKKSSQTTEIDPVSEAEFKRIYSTSGSHTLFKGLHQIQAGTFLQVKKEHAQQIAYWHHLHHYQEVSNQKLLKQELDNTCLEMFQRLVQSLNGKTAVIPLSGGYDSRLIAVMLKKLNYPKVICYTYGRSKGYEALLAKEVAEKLGFPWHFVAYIPQLQQKYFAEDAEQYRRFAFNYASLPHEQDYFALLQLQEQKLIPEGSVIVPGFCGDLLAGSYLPDAFTLKELQPNQQSLAQYIFHRVYEADDSNNDALLQRVLQQIQNPADTQQFVNFFEAWFTKNKVSNYIVHALRVYEHFGYEWRMPLWDDDWMRLWYNIPDDYRYDKKLYKNWMKEQLLQQYDIAREPVIFDKYYGHKNIITKLKRQVPQSIRKLLKPLLVPKTVQDINNLNVLREQICRNLARPLPCKNGQTLNYINATWELQKLKSQITKNKT